ncbi:glycosyltransferase [Christiangramia sediminis]|uniref:Glycosyltransferase n=1 Tax=Christiangramia sediminis TaxID=2881336 RepID=A0A9X1LJ85_9FLAO|nr:glycosyltransferase [Christiangramia sediminis]MCB7481329.1 glycosyltransferase [Christiangramia sediminis]
MIAIVIPYFKITFFKETLASLANQSNKDFHVYIGDDNSPEDPYPLINLYKSKCNLQYKKFDTNLGSISLAKHWERCIEMTRDEEWIMLLGDDDVLSYNVIDQFYKQLNKSEIMTNVIRFASSPIDANGKETWKVFQHPEYESSIDFFFRNRRSSLSEYVFNKNVLKEKGFHDFPIGWCSDILAVLEVSNFSTINSINNAVVYIRSSSMNISNKKYKQREKAIAAKTFLLYLINNKSKKFTRSQRLKLIIELETELGKDKSLSFKDWFKLFRLHLYNFQFLTFFKFSRRFFMHRWKLITIKW